MNIQPKDAERFWAKVDRSGACWIWNGSVASGYGQIMVDGRSRKAHRVAWTLVKGPIPEGLYVCHDCPGGDNKLCVRPDHLFLGTHQENARDASAKGMLVKPKLEVCQRGHPMTEDNRYYPPSRPHKSMCWTCHHLRAAKRPHRGVPPCRSCGRPVVPEPTGRRLPMRCASCALTQKRLIGRTNQRRYRAAERAEWVA